MDLLFCSVIYINHYISKYVRSIISNFSLASYKHSEMSCCIKINVFIIFCSNNETISCATISEVRSIHEIRSRGTIKSLQLRHPYSRCEQGRSVTLPHACILLHAHCCARGARARRRGWNYANAWRYRQIGRQIGR